MRFAAFVTCFSIALVRASAALAGSGVVINEVQSSNGGTLEDRTGEYSDWIELYNGGDEAVALVLSELSAAAVNESTAEGDEATFELTVPERAASLFIQVLPMED